MTNMDAMKFAFNSYITAFLPGNEHMIDQYFASELVFFNHSQPKQYGLNALKSHLPAFHKKYKDLKSEIKDVMRKFGRIAFRVEHTAFYIPESKQVMLHVMNLYKLESGKVKEWRLWGNFPP